MNACPFQVNERKGVGTIFHQSKDKPVKKNDQSTVGKNPFMLLVPAKVFFDIEQRKNSSSKTGISWGQKQLLDYSQPWTRSIGGWALRSIGNCLVLTQIIIKNDTNNTLLIFIFSIHPDWERCKVSIRCKERKKEQNVT